MKLVTPLDRLTVSRIPSALEGKFYLGGPYEFAEMLREPDEYGDEEIDWRKVQIAPVNGVQMRSAQVDVTCGHHHVKPGAWPGDPAQVSYSMRYLYRDEFNSPILGVVQLKVAHEVHGVRKGFKTQCRKAIHAVYVKPSSQGMGIARILLSEVLDDAPDVCVHPQFSEDGARLFGFDLNGSRG
ncbi:GNAT family N-acetyltransferase [Comamonas sp. Z1]|uniref:GNAT family N-acetyltransferase n=1 Tax=Comamonas sp. Z1 TaxID=2601246 RepID=UPI0011E84574|nr:GNAT family N-acetyltransferase [Comamonas sp. Z1]TYK74145.1 GNAT family N-acetyltransferase [Comamonas sp. Z1]